MDLLQNDANTVTIKKFLYPNPNLNSLVTRDTFPPGCDGL